MRFTGVGSSRIAQLALAALMCATLAACGHAAGAAGSAATGNPFASSAAATAAASTTTSPSPSTKAITLSWTRPTQNSDGTSLTNLAGYTLHYGTSSEDYTGTIQITDATQTTYTVSDSSFPPGKYYFAISAYNAQQVSSSLTGEIVVNVD
jgi:hypothetical protein